MVVSPSGDYGILSSGSWCECLPARVLSDFDLVSLNLSPVTASVE